MTIRRLLAEFMTWPLFVALIHHFSSLSDFPRKDSHVNYRNVRARLTSSNTFDCTMLKQGNLLNTERNGLALYDQGKLQMLNIYTFQNFNWIISIYVMSYQDKPFIRSLSGLGYSFKVFHRKDRSFSTTKLSFETNRDSLSSGTDSSIPTVYIYLRAV